MKYTYIIFIFLLNSLLFSDYSKTIFEQNETAKIYYNAGLYEDAINVYKNILEEKNKIFGQNHKELIPTLYEISNIYIILSDIESSEEYLKQALNIQYNEFLKQQIDYIYTFDKIKHLYSVIEDSIKIKEIDSLITILTDMKTDSLIHKLDSLNYFPKIIHFQNNIIDSTNLVSKYSNNDKAIDYFNQGQNYINTGLYSEALQSFNNGLDISAEVIDKQFLLNFQFGDSVSIKQFIQSIYELTEYDSTMTTNNFLLGLLNINLSKDIDDIKESLSLYSKKNPKDIRPYLILGELYFKEKKYIDALTYFYRTTLIIPKHVEGQLFAGICMYYLGNYQDVVEKLKYVLELDQYNGLAKYYIGLSYLNTNHYKQAIQYLTEALLSNYDNDEVYYTLGIAYKSNNQKMQALESFKQTIKINSENGFAHFELGQIYESILKNDLAISEYQKAKKYINNDLLNIKYGTLLFKNKSFKKAMDPLREYIIHNPYNDSVLTYLGEIFISEKRFPEAIDTYNRLVDLNPYHSEYYNKIAQSYYKLGNFIESKEYYKQLLEFNPEDTQVLLNLGDLSNKLFEFKNAEQFLLDAISCNLVNEKLLFELGIAYGGQKKYLQSAQAFKDAIAFSEEKNPILHFQLGVVYQELLLDDLAIKEFEKFLEFESNDSMVNTLIASSYQSLSKFKEAIIYYEKGLKSKNVNSLNNNFQIGKCYASLNQNNNAAKFFKKTLKINPDFAQSRFELINIYQLLNKNKEAKKECDILFMLDRSLFNRSSFCTSS